MTSYSLAMLPLELKEQVLNECSVATLKAVARSSPQWTDAAQRSLFRSVHWPADQQPVGEWQFGKGLGAPFASTPISDLVLFLRIVKDSAHLRTMIVRANFAPKWSRNTRYLWDADLVRLIEWLGRSSQLRQLRLSLVGLDTCLALGSSGLKSLSYTMRGSRPWVEHLEYKRLLRIVRSSSLRTLELSDAPYWKRGIPFISEVRRFSNITTLILSTSACLDEGFEYVLAWFKELKVLDIHINDHDHMWLHARRFDFGTPAPTYVGTIAQFLAPQKNHLQRLALRIEMSEASEQTLLTGDAGLGPGLRNFVALDHLICNITLLVESLGNGRSTTASQETTFVSTPLSPAHEMLPPNFRRLEIELRRDFTWYHKDEAYDWRKHLTLDEPLKPSYEGKRLFAWLSDVPAWKSERFPKLESVVVKRHELIRWFRGRGAFPLEYDSVEGLMNRFEESGITLSFI